jgi:SPP1 family predicted phage head-tail adaptor
MRAGRRDKQVEIQSLALTDDGSGGHTQVWTTYATVWAEIKPMTGAERYAAQQIQPGISHIVTALYRAGVEADDRVKYGTRYFRIAAVLNPRERGQTMELHCEEVKPKPEDAA